MLEVAVPKEAGPIHPAAVLSHVPLFFHRTGLQRYHGPQASIHDYRKLVDSRGSVGSHARLFRQQQGWRHHVGLYKAEIGLVEGSSATYACGCSHGRGGSVGRRRPSWRASSHSWAAVNGQIRITEQGETSQQNIPAPKSAATI
jgi:hypothetical protein